MKCDKLKIYKMIDEDYCDDSFCVVPSDVYLKSEADEVIEALNRQIKFLQVTHSSKCYECNKCADGMGKVFDETLYELKEQKKYILEHTTDVINSQEVEIRRQKYKRCVAMSAYWAAVRYKCIDEKHRRRADKNNKRWLELSKRYKEAKE